jgi:hypothetical protein
MTQKVMTSVIETDGPRIVFGIFYKGYNITPFASCFGSFEIETWIGEQNCPDPQPCISELTYCILLFIFVST